MLNKEVTCGADERKTTTYLPVAPGENDVEPDEEATMLVSVE